MSRSSTRNAGLIALTFFTGAAQAASLPTFATVANIPGGPQIGAIHDNILFGTVPYANPPTLFSLSTTGTYTLLHSFNAPAEGNYPNARLALDAHGNIFGTASQGGADGAGTVWKFSANGVMTVPHTFGSVAGDGNAPMQGPTNLPGGAVVDTTGEGAIGGSGNIFELTSKGSYEVIYKFLSMGDGHCPFSSVSLSRNGTIYGTTVGVGFGGNPQGSVWQFTASGGLKTLYVFQDGADGEYPDQAPAVDYYGNVYGTTHIQNGSNFAGAIWKISATGKFSILHAMNAATDGYAPNSPLVIGNDNLLYGTTGSGGVNGYGTVFSITPKGTFQVVHAFTAGTDGAQPTGNLVRDAAGVIYGGTAYGPVFSLTP